MNKRKKKFIEPRLQLKFGAAFALTAGLSAMVQSLVLSHSLGQIASQLPTDGQLVRDKIPTTLAEAASLTLLLLLPLSVVVGVFVSFRLVGPIYRFKCFLREVIAGKATSDCRIREDDELQDLCQLVNEATAPLRAERKVDEAADKAA